LRGKRKNDIARSDPILLLPGSLIEALGKGKRLREDADYYDRWSEEGANFALKAAGDFLKKAREFTKNLHKSS
jgi:hypothetical protein